MKYKNDKVSRTRVETQINTLLGKYANRAQYLSDSNKISQLPAGFYFRILFSNQFYVYSIEITPEKRIIINQSSTLPADMDPNFLQLFDQTEPEVIAHPSYETLKMQARLATLYFDQNPHDSQKEVEAMSMNSHQQLDMLDDSVESKTPDCDRGNSPGATQPPTQNETPFSRSFPDGILSDHAYQSMKFELRTKTDEVKLTINVGSYNLMNQGHSKQATRGRFANNPYDLDESNEAYQSRKLKQIDHLIGRVSDQNTPEDIIFLQEIDFLVPLHHKNLEEEKVEIYRTLKTRLKNRLMSAEYDLETGYGFIQNPNAPGSVSQQSLAIIYNKKKFKLQHTQGVFKTTIDASKQQYRGLEAKLTLTTAEALSLTVIATNLHLAFGHHNYSQAIQDYEAQYHLQNTLVILGGDTNNPQQNSLPSALGNPHEATTFAISETDNQRFTTQHDQEQLKSYDRFFVVAPVNYYVSATTNHEHSMQIKIDPTGTPVFTRSNDKRPRNTLFGKSYQQPEAIILDRMHKINEHQKKLHQLKNIDPQDSEVTKLETRIKQLKNVNFNMACFIWSEDAAEVELKKLATQISPPYVEEEERILDHFMKP